MTRRWEKTDMKSLMESLLDLFPTPQAITRRLRRERPEDIRGATRELLRRQWSRAGNTKGKLDPDNRQDPEAGLAQDKEGAAQGDHEVGRGEGKREAPRASRPSW
ncbi:MAG: hypothetical protein Q6352_006645 [Candidatus Freyrarchaeum guaymaensis]